MELLSFFLKKDLGKYSPSVVKVMEAGKSVGITVVTGIAILKDNKVLPEEQLEIAESLTNSKRALDAALVSLIEDLRSHALENMGEEVAQDL